MAAFPKNLFNPNGFLSSYLLDLINNEGQAKNEETALSLSTNASQDILESEGIDNVTSVSEANEETTDDLEKCTVLEINPDIEQNAA